MKVPLAPPAAALSFAPPAPDPVRWVGTPVTARAMTGRVGLVEIWTFACKFCRASHPWVAEMQQRHAKAGLTVLAVHSAETEAEEDPAAVAAFAQKHAITWPIFIDDGTMYEALGARGWPTFVLVDRRGRIRALSLGEAAPGGPRARGLEQALKTLLAER